MKVVSSADFMIYDRVNAKSITMPFQTFPDNEISRREVQSVLFWRILSESNHESLLLLLTGIRSFHSALKLQKKIDFENKLESLNNNIDD